MLIVPGVLYVLGEFLAHDATEGRKITVEAKCIRFDPDSSDAALVLTDPSGVESEAVDTENCNASSKIVADEPSEISEEYHDHATTDRLLSSGSSATNVTRVAYETSTLT